jgi:hypothetical protein
MTEHHDRIQNLLDKNPTASRQELAPQIHAISADTHRQIHAPAYRPPERIGKGDAATRARWWRKQAACGSVAGPIFFPLSRNAINY